MSRDELQGRVLRATRALGRELSLFSQAVADRLGLALTDVECLDLLADTGPVTAGRLSELSGLTSGATTRLIDRLEQAGYVRRVADPSDRRRVMVEAVPERMQGIDTLHRSIREAQVRGFGEYSDEDLSRMLTLLEHGVEIVRSEARKMREPEAAEATDAGSFSAPLAAISKARLIFLSGAPNVTLRGDASLRELYRARFDGPVPRMRVRGPAVTVTYPRFGWIDWRARIAGQNLDASVHWRRDKGEIVLNASVRWAVELRGGISRLTADLRSIDVESVDVRGGGQRIDLDLSSPTGVIPIRIAGGVTNLSIRRPAGSAVRVRLHGGAGLLALDGDQVKGAGPMLLESPGADRMRDRYEIELSGGASKVAVSAR